MEKRNILITGANGQLGREMRKVLDGDIFVNAIYTDVDELDITDAQAIDNCITSNNVHFIVNCAAYTAVDAAESNVELCNKLNVEAPTLLAQSAHKHGAKLVHISTDYVFGGDGRVPYKEDDAKNPLGVYGRTKLAGEVELLGSGCKAIIIRTAWLYSPYGKNFVKTMASLMATRPEVGVVADQVGSPTCAEDLAAVICHIIEKGMLGHTGVYHYTDAGVVSWFDFAREICRLGGWDCAVKPLRSSEFPSKVRRPHYSVLDKSKITETFGVEVPYWKDSLARCLQNIE